MPSVDRPQASLAMYRQVDIASGAIVPGSAGPMLRAYLHSAKVATVASNLGLRAYFNRQPSENLASYFAGGSSSR